MSFLCSKASSSFHLILIKAQISKKGWWDPTQVKPMLAHRPLFLFFFNWSIVDLQWFRCTAKWFSYTWITYIYIPFQISDLYMFLFRFQIYLKEFILLTWENLGSSSCSTAFWLCNFILTESQILSYETSVVTSSQLLSQGSWGNKMGQSVKIFEYQKVLSKMWQLEYTT